MQQNHSSLKNHNTRTSQRMKFQSHGRAQIEDFLLQKIKKWESDS